jgi:hypothetical protein
MSRQYRWKKNVRTTLAKANLVLFEISNDPHTEEEELDRMTYIVDCLIDAYLTVDKKFFDQSVKTANNEWLKLLALRK